MAAPPERLLRHAWTLLAPRLHENGFVAEDSAFLAGLAHATPPGAFRQRRAPLLATLLKRTEDALAAGLAPPGHIAALRRLMVEDAAAAGADPVPLVVDQLARCFDGHLPLAYAQHLLAQWTADWWTAGNRVRLRVLLCDRAFEAGFEVRNLLDAGRTAPALGDVLGVSDPAGLAALRLLWSDRPTRPWDHCGPSRTVFELAADPARAGLLGRRPDLLLWQREPSWVVAADDGEEPLRGAEILFGVGGVWLQDVRFTEAPAVVEQTRKAFGFELALGRRRFRGPGEVDALARRMEALVPLRLPRFPAAHGQRPHLAVAGARRHPSGVGGGALSGVRPLLPGAIGRRRRRPGRDQAGRRVREPLKRLHAGRRGMAGGPFLSPVAKPSRPRIIPTLKGILSGPAARPDRRPAPDRHKERLMAEENVETRETSWRRLLPWTELFRGFQVALDLNKLALAAAGILVMAFGWWLLALLFSAGESKSPPQWSDAYLARKEFANNPRGAWDQFRQDRDHWTLMHEAAGVGDPRQRLAPTDRIDGYDEWLNYDAAVQGFDASQKAADAAEKAVAQDKLELDDAIHRAAKPDDDAEVKKAKAALAADQARVKRTPLEDFLKANHFPDQKAAHLASLSDQKGAYEPYGTLSTWPWFEDRGPNPFLMVTGQLGKPWEVGHFWEWLLTQQIPVLLEPIVKLLLPIIYFFSPGADVKSRFYFLCVLIWTVAAWSVFGGAVTRIAAVQVARGEKIGLVDALRFTLKRILSYVTAPLFPLLFIFVLLVVMVLFGYPFMIPIFGDIVMAGLLWPVIILLGVLMAVALVGLVGWPLMSATISAEGTDSWEAVSRSYSYVYQKPWHFIWYTLVALAYGAVVVFFIGFMGSLTVYLAKWGVSQTPGIAAVHREPNFLFVYAPTSYGWRSLLLKGAVVNGQQVVDADGRINEAAYSDWIGANPDYTGPDRLQWWNMIGAVLVAIWLGIVFLLILGFSYSYFWSASTIIYMLLRHNVDAAEMDEVYLEDEEGEGAFGGPLTSPAVPPPAVKPGTQSLTMVDAPSLRPPNLVAPPPVSPPLSSPLSPEAAAEPTAPAPTPTPLHDDGERTGVGTAPPEPRP